MPRACSARFFKCLMNRCKVSPDNVRANLRQVHNRKPGKAGNISGKLAQIACVSPERLLAKVSLVAHVLEEKRLGAVPGKAVHPGFPNL